MCTDVDICAYVYTGCVCLSHFVCLFPSLDISYLYPRMYAFKYNICGSMHKFAYKFMCIYM